MGSDNKPLVVTPATRSAIAVNGHVRSHLRPQLRPFFNFMTTFSILQFIISFVKFQFIFGCTCWGWSGRCMIQSSVYHRSSIMINDVQSLSSAFGYGHSEWSGYEDGQFYKTPRRQEPTAAVLLQVYHITWRHRGINRHHALKLTPGEILYGMRPHEPALRCTAPQEAQHTLASPQPPPRSSSTKT